MIEQKPELIWIDLHKLIESCLFYGATDPSVTLKTFVSSLHVGALRLNSPRLSCRLVESLCDGNTDSSVIISGYNEALQEKCQTSR